MKTKRQKYGGRKAGTPNKTTKQFREQIEELIEYNFEKVQDDIDSLEPKERLNFLVKLYDFVVPKLQRVDATSTNAVIHNLVYLGEGEKPQQRKPLHEIFKFTENSDESDAIEETQLNN